MTPNADSESSTLQSASYADSNRAPATQATAPAMSPHGSIVRQEEALEEGHDELALAAEIAHVRHDLVTPINQIIGYSEMLIEEAEDAGQESFLADLHRIRNATNTLLLLINEFFGSKPGDKREQAGETSGVERAVVNVLRAPETPLSAPLSEQSRLLIVDDLPANRDVLSRRLQRQGHYVATAENGREGLEKLRREPFDLVLLDVLMPEMDGYEMLQQIKADEGLRHLPVIMISALGELDSVSTLR